MIEASDDALIEACLLGDQSAWTALVGRYRNLVYSVPVRYRLSPDDSADIFQQVWLTLYAELPQLRHSGALRSWLVTVAAHKCWHLRQRQNRQGEREESLTVDVAGSTLPDEWRHQWEKEQIVREAIARLPERCQIIVNLLFFEDPPIPYSELAARLGLAEGSVGFVRGRCLKKLREHLERAGF